MGKPDASNRQKEYLREVSDRFGIKITNDRLMFMDVFEASKAIGIMKQAEKVADWLEEKTPENGVQ